MKDVLLLLLVLFGWQSFLQGQCEARDLHGCVINMDTAPVTPVISGIVKIKTFGKETTLNSNGEFFVRIPDTLLPGEEIEVEIVNAIVNNKRLLLFQPQDGRIRIPGGRGNKLVQIGVLPEGSRRFLRDESIAGLLKMANERGYKKATQLDLKIFLEEWGKEHGFEPSEVVRRVAQWVDQIESQPTADREQRALAALAKNELLEAKRLFHEAADDHLRRSEELGKWLKEEHLAAAEDYEQSGDAQLNAMLYRSALDEYLTAVAECDRDQYPSKWADLKVREGIAYTGLGETQEGGEAIISFNAAIDDFRAALLIFRREDHPQDWATTQNSLALALAGKGSIAQGVEGERFLNDAVKAYQNALQVLTPEKSFSDWAQTSNNLGDTLRVQGERSGGEEGQNLLKQALEIHLLILSRTSQEKFPQEWALAENGLANAWQAEAERSEPEVAMKLLAEAVDAYQKTLLFFTQSRNPLRWATTQNNLGIVLLKEALRSGGEERRKRLQQAVAAHHNALLVFVPEQSPQDWAVTNGSLGNALEAEAEHAEPGEAGKLLDAAVDADRQALRIFTHTLFPQRWAWIQHNLGNALSAKAEQATGGSKAELAAEAAEAYKNALLVFTHAEFAIDWARTENNLGDILVIEAQLSKEQQAKAFLAEAITAYRNALEVRVRTQLPRDWAISQIGLANALTAQGEHTQGDDARKLLAEAVEAYGSVETVFNRDQFPENWASLQTNLGSALKAQGEKTEGQEGEELLAKAVNALRNALQIFTRKDAPRQWAASQYVLGSALYALGQHNPTNRAVFVEAAQAFSEYLDVYPQSPDGMAWLAHILHERLFEFQRAFVVGKQRVDLMPSNPAVIISFIEASLTAEQFAECVKISIDLRPSLGQDDPRQHILYILEASCDLGQGHIVEALASLREWNGRLASEHLHTTLPQATFAGTKYFISSNSAFSHYRDFLLRLYSAFESGRVDLLKEVLKDSSGILATMSR